LVGSGLLDIPGVGVGLLATKTMFEVLLGLRLFFAVPLFDTFWNFAKVLRKDQARS
jgi:hypothetical protein